jgi:hypothetical protein
MKRFRRWLGWKVITLGKWIIPDASVVAMFYGDVDKEQVAHWLNAAFRHRSN